MSKFFCADEAECCSRKYSSNYTHDPSGISLPDIQHRTDILLYDMYITLSMFSAIITKLDRHKACALIARSLG